MCAQLKLRDYFKLGDDFEDEMFFVVFFNDFKVF